MMKMTMNGSLARPLFEHMVPHGVLKTDQARIALETLDPVRDKAKDVERADAVKALHHSYREVKIDEQRLVHPA